MDSAEVATTQALDRAPSLIVASAHVFSVDRIAASHQRESSQRSRLGAHACLRKVSLLQDSVQCERTVKSEAPSTMQLDWISGEGYVCSAGSIHGRRQGLRSPP